MPQPDKEDFERLMRQSYRLAYRIAYSVLNNAADAEDATQEAFLSAYKKMSSLRDQENFRPWVARAVWRVALNRKRGSTRTMGRDHAWITTRPAVDDPEEQAADQEFESRLRAQVDLLPEKLRTVVQLIGVEEMDVRTVAGILDIPEGTVRSRLHLARKQLLRAIAPREVMR